MQLHLQFLKMIIIAVFLIISACATEKNTVKKAPVVESQDKPQPKNNSYGITEYEAAVNTYHNGNFEESVKLLEDFIKTKTKSRFNLDAYLWLGKAYMETKHFEKAKKAFTHYSSAKGTTPEGYEGKIWIGKALLASNKSHEALLSSLEIVDLPKAKDKMALHTFLSALLVRADSLMQLGNDLQASQALDSYKDESRMNLNAIPKDVQAYAKNLEIRLKIRTCEKLPEKGRLEEQQVRSQIQRRGICLYETIPIYEELLAQRVYPRVQMGIEEIVQAYQDYRRACLSPPDPKEKRSSIELRRYKEELSDILVRDCQSYVKRATYLLESWMSKTTNRNFNIEDPIYKYINELLTRIDQVYANGNKKRAG